MLQFSSLSTSQQTQYIYKSLESLNVGFRNRFQAFLGALAEDPQPIKGWTVTVTVVQQLSTPPRRRSLSTT